jgi:predicted SnoaL-like aldol condensation-catalyzing enzyme
MREDQELKKIMTARQNKAIVRDFGELAFNHRQPERAAAKYLAPDYRQHSPMATDGAPAFIAFVKSITASHPDLRFEFKRFIAEGDLVVVHSHFVPASGARGSAVVDIFRLADGKIVEHWDVSQEVPEKAENQNTMF